MIMKILAAYDGSKCSDKLIDDLQFAGFPDKGVEMIVMSVAEVWMPPPPSPNGNGFDQDEFPAFVNEWAERRLKVAKSAVNEADTLSRHAQEKIAQLFPKWKVSSFSTYGSPAWEILNKADEFRPDVITLGSQGRNAVERILLGSVSQKILTEAKCSVRIARSEPRDETLPNRVLMAFDGSRGAEMAVDAVASRSWSEDAEFRLVAAVQSLVPSTIGRFIPPVTDWVGEDFEAEKQLIRKLSEGALAKLENAGLKTSLEIEDGNPKEVLVGYADRWQATSIFLGAHAYSSELAKFLVGCTSTAVAERAYCSVEAVRPPVTE